MAGRDDIPPDPEQVEAFRPLPGDLLTGARRSRGWSRERVAQELNLDPPTIAALEENEFDRLGAPVFARGHLKKYALLMGLDEAAVLSAYDAVAEEPIAPSTASSAPAPSLADPSPRRRAGGLRVVLGLIVVAAIGVLVWRVTSNGNLPLAGNQTGDQASDQAGMPDTLPEGSVTLTLNEASPLSLPGSETEAGREADAVPTSNTALTGQSESQLASSGDAGAAVVEAAGSAMPGTAPEAASEAVSDAVSDTASETAGETTPQPARSQIDPETVTVDLIFNDDSWVEVRDPAGQRLIYRLGRAGERRSLEGNPPLRVFFGNAEGVSVMVEGKPYLIPSDKRLGNTARFVIEADATPAGGSQDD